MATSQTAEESLQRATESRQCKRNNHKSRRNERRSHIVNMSPSLGFAFGLTALTETNQIREKDLRDEPESYFIRYGRASPSSCKRR